MIYILAEDKEAQHFIKECDCIPLTLKQLAVHNHTEVITREGRKYIFVGSSFYNTKSDGWLRDAHFNDDLTNSENNKFDIMKITYQGKTL